MAHPGYGYSQGPPIQDPRNPFSQQAYPQGYPQTTREYDAESEMGDPYGSTARLTGANGFYDSELRGKLSVRPSCTQILPSRPRFWVRERPSQLRHLRSIPLSCVALWGSSNL